MPKPEASHYMKSHEWVALAGDLAVVGLSDHAQKEITDVVFVEMPQVGRQVKQGEGCCVIESVKAAFDLYAPISGEIVEINDKVVSDPALVNRSPHDEGWLYKVKPVKADEAFQLMDYKKYQEFLKTAADGNN